MNENVNNQSQQSLVANNSKSSNNGIKALLILLLVSVLCFGGYFVYYILSKDNNPDENNNNNEAENLDITSNQVKQLYSYIPQGPNFEDNVNKGLKDAYQDKKVTVADISNEVLVSMVVMSVPYDFSLETINNDTKNMYNLTTSLSAIPDLKIMYETSLLRYNSATKSYELEGGIDLNSVDASIIKSANKKEEVITIYVNHYYIKSFCSAGETEDCYKIYSDSAKTHLVATVDAFDDQTIQTYASSADEYKHTFKKATNGDYYWYSSEPVNE